MFTAIPSRERGLSIRSVLVAVSALITDIIESNDHRGGVVELLHCTHLALKNANVCAPAGRQRLDEPGGSGGFACLTSAGSVCGGRGRHPHIVTRLSQKFRLNRQAGMAQLVLIVT
ncbi:hypothetical protein D3C86_1150610 [compost metagenome]